MKFTKLLLTLSLFGMFAGNSSAGDWPLWGRTADRNMMSPEKNMPLEIHPGEPNEQDPDIIELKTTKGVKWIAKLGSQAYGNVTVSQGKVFLGTNNDAPFDKRFKDQDRSLVLCLDEKTGDFIWNLSIPKLGAGKVSDWEYLGVCSSPQVEGNRVYVVTNRCEIMCLDIDGMKNGNQGMKDEGKYMAGAGKPPLAVADYDADIIWIYDMRDELGIFPHNVTSSSVLIHGDRVYASTSNGVDWSHINIPNPLAPSLIVLDKKTGELVGEEGSKISERIFHCNWSSPASTKINGQDQIIFGAGDGFCYGFSTETKPLEEDGETYDILQELWRYDCTKMYRLDKDGKKTKYATGPGPSEIIASPVVYKNRIYVSIGQDPEHGEGVGNLVCIDMTKKGDITETGKIWNYTKIDRTISTVSIADNLVYVADYSGKIHCLDADTGKVYWVHDTGSHIWGSTLVADGKLYLGDEDGVLTILEAGKKLKVLKTLEFSAPIYSSAVAANGVLYIGTQTHLYAFDGK